MGLAKFIILLAQAALCGILEAELKPVGITVMMKAANKMCSAIL